MARYVVELTTDVDYIDPALDYLSSGWEIQYATACKLFNYPDKAAPRARSSRRRRRPAFPIVSKDGKTYTFTIKPGVSSSRPAKAVTAASFADAINRIANPKLQSPATPFMDVIVGAAGGAGRQGHEDLRRHASTATSSRSS